MSFSQATITHVSTEIELDGLLIEWESSSPEGTLFQVYVNQVRVYGGPRRYVKIPYPRGEVHVDVGTVAAGEANVNHASSLPSAPERKAWLRWPGGTYLDPTGEGDVKGFRVYGESSPGSGINYSLILADIPAYGGGQISDGYGLGGYGHGGYGQAASYYEWRSAPLSSGTWHFGVRAYDRSGNEATPFTASVVIATPPRAPAAYADASRLTYTYDPDDQTVTICWNESPG